MTAVAREDAAAILLDAQHVQKYAYDDEGRPIRGTDVLLLADACLELRAGEVHALVGENGAGKSTLIEVIGGALPYEGGSLQVMGASAARPPSRGCVGRASRSSGRS